MPKNVEHEVFTLIVLHNKLATAEDLKAFLQETPDVQACIERMVASNFFSAEVARKLMSVYRKKLEKVKAEGGATAVASTAAQAAARPTASRTAATVGAGARAGGASTFMPDANSGGLETATTSAEAHRLDGKSSSAILKDVDVTKPGRKLVEQLLLAARQIGASDIHIRADEIPSVRQFGNFQDLDVPVISSEVAAKSLFALLTDDQRAHFEKHRDLDFCYEGDEELGRFRANLFDQHRGVAGVFRLISNEIPSFEELGIPKVIKRFTEYRTGLVLVTGPKGCGKTTTLAALINLINETRQEHIITLEDPIEYVHPCKKGHVNQREVGRDTLAFGNALRAALREAPDVIMVGEMRDLETISLAITAAETGHLVFGTLHTPDATRTVNRVLDVFPPKEQGQIRAMVSESLRGIVSQVLVPGADGRSMHPACEILVNTSAIGNLIRDDRAFQIRGVMQTGKKLGMVTMDESLLELVRAGKITKEDAVARADNANQMRRELGMPLNAL